MEINKINKITFESLYKVLSSPELTEVEKTKFVQANKIKIAKVVNAKISSTDFKVLMGKRKLKKFRPLKNSFTKKGDKLILSKALNINPSELVNYIKVAKDNFYDINKIDFLSPEKMELLKTYVYRHGSKDDLVTFLDYELTKSNDKLNSIYKTLQYYSGGIADYFIRPIHRLDNQTLIRLYNVITKHIEEAKIQGHFSETEYNENALWALSRIYEIQNNSKLINAIKTYRVLR